MTRAFGFFVLILLAISPVLAALPVPSDLQRPITTTITSTRVDAHQGHGVAADCAFVPLGDLPEGLFVSTAQGVSGNGQLVVGNATPLTGNWAAFRWTATSGMLPLTATATFSQAEDASLDGSVIVGRLASQQASSEAFRWTAADGMVGLGWLGGPSAERFSYAYGVSADGSVVVGNSCGAVNCTSSGVYGEAFRWTAATGMVGLGDLPGGIIYSQAFDVSADGSVIVGRCGSTLGNEACVWTPATGLLALGIFPVARSAPSPTLFRRMVTR